MMIMETDKNQIWRHVEWIASQPRYAETERLEECRQYCAAQLADTPWRIERQSFEAESSVQQLSGVNLVGRLPEFDPA